MTKEDNSRTGKWRQEFAQKPFEALDKLLFRRFYMGVLNRNETDEILFLLFHDKSNKVLAQLDGLMKQWFENYWGKIPGNIVPGRWANILQNAFIAVYRLNLAETVLFLKNIYMIDRSWIRSLYLGPARDPEGNLLRTLALSQKDQILLPLWMRLCRMEEDLPIDYASIGLLGLRKLPEIDGSPPGDLPTAVFKGIIVLAEALGKRKSQQCREHWLMEVRAIAALYPRSKNYWALHFLPFIYHQPQSIPAQWLNKAIPNLDNYFKPKSADYIQPPAYERRNHFLNLIKNYPLEKFYEDLKIFLNEHRKYSYQTGDSSFLVKTFSDIGYRILKQDTALALELVEEAFAWEPSNPFLWSQRAIIEAYRGNGPQAAAILWEARRRFPENPQIRTKLAHLMEKQGKTKTAEILYRQAIEDFPRNEVCRAGLADVLKAQNRLKEAEEVYRQAIKDFPRNEFCRNGLAEVLKAQNRLKEAEEVYRQAIADFPRNEVCRAGLADVLKAQNRLKEAEEVYRQAIKDFPRNEFCRAGLADVLKAQNRLKEAEEVYRQAIADFPRNEVCRNGLAEVLKAQNRLKEAEEVYRQAIADFPRDAVCRNGLAEVLKSQNRLKEAEKVYHQTIEIFPRNAVCLTGLAVVLIKKKQENEAMSILKETLDAFPGNEIAKGLLEKLKSGAEISEEDEKVLELAAVRPGEKDFLIEPEHEDDLDLILSDQTVEISHVPKEKEEELIEKTAAKTGASVIQAKEPGEYGIPISPGIIHAGINELEIKIGEITGELRENQGLTDEEKEKHKHRISSAITEVLEKAPANIPGLLVKGLWLTDYETGEAGDFFSRQTQSHPNILGFRLLDLRTKHLKDKETGDTLWNELIGDFPGRSTIIKLGHALWAWGNLEDTNGSFLKEVEKLRKQLSKDTQRLPFSLQKNEEWVKQTIQDSIFVGIDLKDALSSKSLDAIKENFKEKEIRLRDTVNQCILSAV